MKILLVDAEVGFRAALAGNLRDDGHEVIEFGTAADLPPLTGLTDVAIVLTEYDMPGEDGLKFADRFHSTHPGTPILLLTAYDSAELEARLTSRRFVRRMRKPIDYETLHELLHRLSEVTTT